MQVETINDIYMVAGGIPTETPHHAELVCHMARAMLESVKKMKNPANSEDHIKIKIGHLTSFSQEFVNIFSTRE